MSVAAHKRCKKDEYTLETSREIFPRNGAGGAGSGNYPQPEDPGWLKLQHQPGEVPRGVSGKWNIPIDSSATERAIRLFTIGRANWHIVDTIHGAEANKLKIYEHLKQLLTEIPKHMDETNMDFREDLLPWSEKLPEECHKNT